MHDPTAGDAARAILRGPAVGYRQAGQAGPAAQVVHRGYIGQRSDDPGSEKETSGMNHPKIEREGNYGINVGRCKKEDESIRW